MRIKSVKLSDIAGGVECSNNKWKVALRMEILVKTEVRTRAKVVSSRSDYNAFIGWSMEAKCAARRNFQLPWYSFAICRIVGAARGTSIQEMCDAFRYRGPDVSDIC